MWLIIDPILTLKLGFCDQQWKQQQKQQKQKEQQQQQQLSWVVTQLKLI